MKTLLLIDTYNLLFRAHYAISVRHKLTSPDGLPTGAIYGLSNMIESYLALFKPDFVIACYDSPAKTFRHDLYEAYKGTRKPMPEDLRQQIPKAIELIEAMGICVYAQAGYEADDLIGSFSQIGNENGLQTIVVTGDRDCLQLIGDQTQVYLTSASKSRADTLVDEKVFGELYEGLKPLQIIDLKALEGDKSDNIPGVAGVGGVTATKLLLEHNSLQNIYDHLDEVCDTVKQKLNQDRDQAFLSYDLATICRTAPVPTDLATFASYQSASATDHLITLYRELGFSQKLKRIRPNVENSESNLAKLPRIFNLVESAAEFWDKVDPTKPVVWVFFQEHLLVAQAQQAYICETLEIELNLQKLRRLSVATITYDYKEMCINNNIEPFELVPFDLKIASYVLASHLRSDFTVYLEFFGIDVANQETSEESSVRQASFFGEEEKVSPETQNQRIQETLLRKLDALIALECVVRQRVNDEEIASWLSEVEYPLANTLLEMQLAGIGVDSKRLCEIGDNFENEIKDIEARIESIINKKINLNSPAQLSDLLYIELGLKSGKKRTQGRYSTNDQELTRLELAHPIIPLIMRHRQLSKLQSTFINGMLRHVGSDGRIRTTYQQTVTVTGRLSSTSPNLQNIPVREKDGRLLRSAFVAEPGNVLLDADYSQIELRLLAHLSGDYNLRQAFINQLDVHTQTAAAMFMIPLDEVSDEQRRAAKTVNFSIIYGVSAFSLARDLGLSNYEAKMYIERVHLLFPEAFRYLEQLIESAKECGFVTTIAGRRRYLPELKSSNYQQRSFGERAAMNAPMQGSASDLIKKAMVNVAFELKMAKKQAKLVMQIHDELILDVPLGEVEFVSATLKRCMESAMELSVPLLAEVKVGKTWLEAKGD